LLQVVEGLIEDKKMALTFVGTVGLPFGDDQMLLGDSNLVYEPKLAFELRRDRIHQTRFVANVGARIRQRAVLEGYDSSDSPKDPFMNSDDAKVFLDIGSEAVAGVGGLYELTPRAVVAAEAQAFIPLPTSIGYGTCKRFNGFECSTIKSSGAAAPATAYDGRQPISVVAARIMTSAATSAALRPCRSPKCPKITPPTGRAKNPTANVLKEAMAVGVPVVSTRHGGIPELVEDGVSGVLVPERDPEALAAQLAELAAHPERRAELAAAGRVRVERDYDIERLNDRLVTLFAGLSRTAGTS
jgi:glycosyltransferase involved in cell wall biosynthesis